MKKMRIFAFIIAVALALTSCVAEAPAQPTNVQNAIMVDTLRQPPAQEAEPQAEPMVEQEVQAEPQEESAPVAPSLSVEVPPAPVVEVERPFRQMEEETINLINLEREQAGLSPLATCDIYYDLVRLRTEECLEYWSHTRPDGTRWATVYPQNIGSEGIFKIGENLGKNFKTIAQVMEGFMGSETHRNTILDPEYTHVSVAIVAIGERGDSGQTYYAIAQHFYKKEDV